MTFQSLLAFEFSPRLNESGVSPALVAILALIEDKNQLKR